MKFPNLPTERARFDAQPIGRASLYLVQTFEDFARDAAGTDKYQTMRAAADAAAQFVKTATPDEIRAQAAYVAAVVNTLTLVDPSTFLAWDIQTK